MRSDKLNADSGVYLDKSDIYELFSQAEDYPKKILEFFVPLIKDKIILDFGCGTGKFIPDLSQISKKCIGVDVSDSQLKIAREKSLDLHNVEIIKIENDVLPLEDASVDIVLSSWVLGSIKDLKLRKNVLEELKRVLKPGGVIYLIENDKGGEYKKIIDGVNGDEKTELKLEWLRNSNFWELKKIETYFEFESTEIAKQVFESIWDAETAEEISKKTLSHNIVILEYTPNIVLDSTKYVIDQANYVNINKFKLQEFIDNFSLQTESNWLKDSPFDINTLDNEQKLMVAVVFNAISFSYWGEPYWNVEYKGTSHTRGSWSLMASIFRSIEEGESLLDPSVLASMTKEKLAHILRGNTEIPLLEERVEILNNVGNVVIEKYKGKFSNVLVEAQGDAMRLLNIILTEFSSSFEDSYDYKGQKVYFNKRAQAMVESIHSIFDGKEYGSLKNIELLTALADYIIPNMLRNAGVLEYSPELTDKIDRKELLPKGSEYEIELRAGVVWTVEYIRRGLLQKGILVSSKSINDYLWTQGGSVKTPFHQTRTTAY